MLHVQNWKSSAQGRDTWRKKTSKVMTRIRAETPKKRESEEWRGEKTEKYPYSSDLKGISYHVLIGGVFLISKWRNTKNFSQLYQLLPVRCLTSLWLYRRLRRAQIKLQWLCNFPRNSSGQNYPTIAFPTVCPLDGVMYQQDCAVGVVYRGSLVRVGSVTDSDEIAS